MSTRILNLFILTVIFCFLSPSFFCPDFFIYLLSVYFIVQCQLVCFKTTSVKPNLVSQHFLVPTSLLGFPLYTTVCLSVGLSDGRQGFGLGDLFCVRSKLWYFQLEFQFHGKPQLQPHEPQSPPHTVTRARPPRDNRVGALAVWKTGKHTHLDLVCTLTSRG